MCPKHITVGFIYPTVPCKSINGLFSLANQLLSQKNSPKRNCHIKLFSLLFYFIFFKLCKDASIFFMSCLNKLKLYFKILEYVGNYTGCSSVTVQVQEHGLLY